MTEHLCMKELLLDIPLSVPLSCPVWCICVRSKLMNAKAGFEPSLSQTVKPIPLQFPLKCSLALSSWVPMTYHKLYTTLMISCCQHVWDLVGGDCSRDGLTFLCCADQDAGWTFLPTPKSTHPPGAIQLTAVERTAGWKRVHNFPLARDRGPTLERTIGVLSAGTMG